MKEVVKVALIKVFTLMYCDFAFHKLASILKYNIK